MHLVQLPVELQLFGVHIREVCVRVVKIISVDRNGGCKRSFLCIVGLYLTRISRYILVSNYLPRNYKQLRCGTLCKEARSQFQSVPETSTLVPNMQHMLIRYQIFIPRCRLASELSRITHNRHVLISTEIRK